MKRWVIVSFAFMSGALLGLNKTSKEINCKKYINDEDEEIYSAESLDELERIARDMTEDGCYFPLGKGYVAEESEEIVSHGLVHQKSVLYLINTVEIIFLKIDYLEYKHDVGCSGSICNYDIVKQVNPLVNELKDALRKYHRELREIIESYSYFLNILSELWLRMFAQSMD